MKEQQLSQFDQYRISRQLAVFGIQTQKKFMNLKIFIHGINGLGVQVVKNLIMMEPQSITLYDQTTVTMNDVGRNFFCSEQQIGKLNRSEASLQKLQKLNHRCKVTVTQNCNIDFIIKNFDCVIMIDNYNKKYLSQLNLKCRQNKIGFIVGGCLGLYGYVFNDFGQNHIVYDPTGEENEYKNIYNIEQGQKTIVNCIDWDRHGLQTGDIVEFKTLKEMTQINSKRFKVKVNTLNSFQIQEDTRNFSPYLAEGAFKKIIPPVQIGFKSFEQSLQCKLFEENTFDNLICSSKQSKSTILHFVLTEIYQFYQKHGMIPRLLNQQDSQEILKNVKQNYDFIHKPSNKDKANLDLQIVRNVVLYAQTQISPICSIFGSIIAQQVVKLTGKFMPIHQWLDYEHFDLLPDKSNEQITRSLMTQNNRYRDYIALFGDQFMLNCQQFKILLCGVGSLGCQHLKNLAMMGVSTGQSGKIMIADDKNTKITNLNSHFMLNQKDLGASKVKSVFVNAKQINKQINIEPSIYRVEQKTQEIYNDDLWNQLDFVISAVDNAKSINYIDQRCIWYQKPFFYSSLQGLNGASQVILPHKTSTITDQVGPCQYSIDYSTLLNFPYKTQHLIHWASFHRFNELFTDSSETLKQFYASPKNYLQKIKNNMQKEYVYIQSIIHRLKKLKSLYQAKSSKSYQKCVGFMVEEFQQWLINRMIRTIQNFDLIEDQYKRKNFWTGLKKKPQPLSFDIRDPLTLQFIHSGVNIFATILKVPIEKNSKQIQKIAQKIYLAKRQNQKQFSNDQQEYERLMMQVSKFEVDQQEEIQVTQLDLQTYENWHLQYVHAATNLRAKVYRIDQADRLKIRKIAGKFTSKTVACSSMTAGLTAIEIIKYLLKKDLTEHTNSQFNLALMKITFYQLSRPLINRDNQYDPIMMGPIRVIPGQFSKWEKIDIKQFMLICQLIQHFKKKYNVKVLAIAYGSQFIYSEWMPIKSKTRLIKSVQDAVSETIKKKIHRYTNFLKIQIMAETQNGTDCLFPSVRYFISKKKYQPAHKVKLY